MSFDRIDIVIFLFHVFFFHFWHHFAEKWRHKFGTEFRNLVLQGGWEEERERWERGCKFCFTLEYFKAAVFETTLYKWLLHTLGFTTRTKTPLLHSCPIQVDETWQESCPVQFSRSKNDEFASEKCKTDRFLEKFALKITTKSAIPLPIAFRPSLLQKFPRNRQIFLRFCP